MTQHLDMSMILSKNPQIDAEVVAEYQRYRDAMASAGVDLTPKYQVVPPMGADPVPADDVQVQERQLLSFRAR